MDQLADKLPTIGVPVTESPSYSMNRPKMKRTWILALFKKFEAIYGDLWLRRLGTEEKLQITLDAWAEGIADLTPEQIKDGIDGVAKNLAYPPSIAEFRQFAKPKKPEMEAYHAAPLALSGTNLIESDQSKRVRLREMGKIREILGGSEICQKGE